MLYVPTTFEPHMEIHEMHLKPHSTYELSTVAIATSLGVPNSLASW